MNKTRSPSKHPIAVFSKAEIDKYQKYANFGIDVEVVDSDPWNGGRPQKPNFFDRVGYKVEDYLHDRHQREVQILNQRVKQNPGIKHNPAVWERVAKRTSRLYDIKEAVRRNPRAVGLMVSGIAGLGAAGAVGAGAVTFIRRRRTKKGKIVVEQVRKRQ